MDPWFDDLPLDFSRKDTRAAERIFVQAYPRKPDALRLARVSGLDPASIEDPGAVADLVTEILQSARAAERLVRVIAELMADPSRVGFAGRMQPLVAGQEARLQAALLHDGPSLAQLARLPPSVELRAPGQPPRPLATPGLERVVNDAAGFADIAHFRDALASAEVRTCRILDGGRPRGTGFLVASDLVLTCWHVVAGMKSGSVQFDHKVLPGGTEIDSGRKVPFADAWNVAHGDHASSDEELSPNGPAAKWLDYALVRIAAPVGDQPIGEEAAAGGDTRRWYELDGEPYAFEVGDPILIVGHPLGRPMQLSYAAPSNVRTTAAGCRVRYETNTEAGSSGSPVFDKEFRVVALHQAGGPTTQPGLLDSTTDDFNQGVPISAIVADLRAQLGERPDVIAALGWPARRTG